MVRLMLTLTPIVCVFAAIAFSHTFENYLKDDPVPGSEVKSSNDSTSEVATTPLKDPSRVSIYLEFVKTSCNIYVSQTCLLNGGPSASISDSHHKLQ